MMPAMDGLELVQRVKEYAAFAQVTIVVMTGSEFGYLTWAWSKGANETLAKPSSPEDLFTAILNVLPESRGH